MKPTKVKQKGIYLAIIGSILWGASGIIAEYLMTEYGVSSMWIVTIKMLFAGLLTLLYVQFTSKQSVIEPFKTVKDVSQLMIFSVVGIIMLQVTFFKAVEESNAATATILQYLSPVFLVIYFAVKFKKKPSKLSLISVLLSIVGTFFLITQGDIRQLATSPMGIVWGILAGVTGAFYIVQPRELMAKYGSILVIGWGMTLGGLFFQLYQPIWKNVPVLNWQVVLGMAFIVVFGTVFTYIFLLESTAYIPPQFSSLLTSFEPISSVVFSFMFLGTNLSMIEVISMFVIIFSVFLLSRTDDM